MINFDHISDAFLQFLLLLRLMGIVMLQDYYWQWLVTIVS
jgi:hypothetical protein